MYFPKRLQENFEAKEEKRGANIIIKGILSCCEQPGFDIAYLGEIKTGLFGHKSLLSDDDIVLSAECKICGKEIQVFNSYTDGYDNCIDIPVSPPPYKSKTFSCAKCGANHFSAEVTFEYAPKEELEACGIQDCGNAFSWIWVTIVCESCKKAYKKIIDFETA